MPTRKQTQWKLDFIRPRIEWLETGSEKNPSFLKVVHIQFGRHSLLEGATGAFVDVLGAIKKPTDLIAITGGPGGLDVIYAGTSADRDFVCIVDEITPEIAHASFSRQTQVWEMKKEPVAFVFPTA